LVVMILQVAGAGAWTQLLTTHGEGNLTPPARTLFVGEDAIDYLLVQGRPAGILYSNIILALLILYAIVLHFSRRRATFGWWTVVLCAAIVLCMSKAVFIGVGIAVMWLMLVGGLRQKVHAFKAAILIAVFLKAYGFFFPGLLAVNLSSETITTSLYLRANDIMGALGPDSVLKKFDRYLDGTPRASWAEEGEHVSGYTAILARVDFATIGICLALGAMVYLRGLRRFRRLAAPGASYRETRHRQVLALMLLGAYPVSFPIWATPVYWFMMGLALLPLIILVRPYFLRPHSGSEAVPGDPAAQPG